MSLRNLDALFRPAVVALVCGDGVPGAVGRALIRNLTHGGFTGPVLPVAPGQRAVEGVLAYDSIAALPETPDLAVVATPPADLAETLRALVRRGGRAAILSPEVEAPLSEADRRALLEAARPGLLRLVGPGGALISPHLGLNASAEPAPAAGDLAFVTPSAAMARSLLAWAAPRGIGFAQVVTLGQRLDVDLGDTLDMLARDPRCRAVLLYVEHIEQARKFMSAARAAARIRPVIAVRGDRFAELPADPESPGAAAPGLDAVYEAAFRRAGMLRVGSLRELFDAAETLATAPSVKGDRLAVVGNGAGPGTLAVDAALADGAQVVSADPNGSAGSGARCVQDLGVTADGARYAKVLSAALDDGRADGAVAIHSPVAGGDPVAVAQGLASALGARRRPVFAAWLGGAGAAKARQLLGRHGIASYQTPEEAVRAFCHLVAHRRSREALMETPPALPRDYAPDVQSARDLLAVARRDGQTRLDAGEARQVLAAFGVPVVASETVADADAAVAAAGRIGYPVALKAQAPGLVHKSEVGGVELELDSEDAVRAAARRMAARVVAARPDAGPVAFTVQPMVRRPGATELFLGLRDGGPFGPVVVFGHGGTAVAAYQDLRVGLPPLNLMLARRLIAETRVSRLLDGHSRSPAADRERVALALVALSELAATCPEVRSVTVNPLLADAQGVLALDVALRLHDDARAAPGLAIRPYPRELARRARTQDGLEVWLRPIRPEDEPALQAMFHRLDPEDVRLRFFAPLKDLSHAFAARLTQIDYDREMALVATDPADESTIWGVVRLSTDPDRALGEYAVLVRSDLKGRGLGYVLMSAIIDHARAQGVGRIEGDVLAENTAMLELCRDLGFTVGRSPEDPQIRRVRLPLVAAPAVPDSVA